MRIFIKGMLISLCFAVCNINAKETHVTAHAWLVADENGKMIGGNHTNEIRAIASITKLMTVMVILDSEQSLLELMPKKLYNQRLVRGQLIELAMIKSDNNAAKMLCDNYPNGTKSCVAAMNAKARYLGMTDTVFTEPTGLYDTNISTAEDLVKLVHAASQYPVIVNASSKPTVTIATSKKKYREFHNTNSLVGTGYEFIVTKTGWIRKSGGCIVFMMKTTYGAKIVILLGSKNTHTRIPEAQLLASLY